MYACTAFYIGWVWRMSRSVITADSPRSAPARSLPAPGIRCSPETDSSLAPDVMIYETLGGTWRIINTMDDGMEESVHLPYWTSCKGPPQVVRIRTKVVIWREWRPGRRSPSRWSRAGGLESCLPVSACGSSQASGESVSFFSSPSPKGPFRVSVYDEIILFFCCWGSVVMIFVKGNIWIIRERKYSECGIGIFFPHHSASLNASGGCRCINTNRSYLAPGIEEKSKKKLQINYLQHRKGALYFCCIPVWVIKGSIQHSVPYSRNPNIRTHPWHLAFGFRQLPTTGSKMWQI